MTYTGPGPLVREFHERFALAINADPDYALRSLRFNLIEEEYDEVFDELLPDYLKPPGPSYTDPEWADDPTSRREKLAKELADLVIVTYGTAISLGIDLDEAVRRVHESNMSKLGPEGLPLYREDGKVLKGPDYREPSMKGVAG